MTREEAISHIKYSIKAYQNLIENDARSGEAIGKDIKGEWKSEKTLADAYMKMIESLTMAIKALEQEPCEDCISREKFIKRFIEWHCSEYGRRPSYDALAIRVAISLPPVNPQEAKQGHWIYDDDVLSYEGHFGAYTCSCCNKTFLDDLCMDNGSDEINVGNEFKYCPFCGARMSEVNE